MEEQELIERIQAAFPQSTIEAAGENCSFEVYIIDEAFEGKKTLERQKSVLSLFAEEITKGKLHALTVRARTPQEMEKLNPAGLVQLT